MLIRWHYRNSLIELAKTQDVLTIKCDFSTCTMSSTANHLESNMWRYYDMIDSGSADFNIVIAQDQSVIGVHKLILETHWQHFRRMMESGMTEARSSSWEIEDFDYCTMKSLVVFIYTGVTHILNASDAADVLRAAHVYDLKILFDQVATDIVSVVSDADVLKVLPLAHLHNLSDVKLKCFEVLVSSLRSSKKSIDSLVGYKAFEDDPTFKLLIREVLTYSMK
ncbi:hypothetical protein HDE_13469 [Halotydeus destructor]|nr:hypothetical protein HDE_13469 [Halotydeus destructor]